MAHKLECLNRRDRYMIGDWVLCNGKPYRWTAADYNRTQKGMEEITDIPLTEEILKANGFWFGLLPDEQDILSVGLGVSIDYEERWVFDNENSGTFSIQFPEDSNGGQIVICNDDKYFSFVWAEDTTTVNVHDLQHFLRDCKLYDLADNFKIE